MQLTDEILTLALKEAITCLDDQIGNAITAVTGEPNWLDITCTYQPEIINGNPVIGISIQADHPAHTDNYYEITVSAKSRKLEV